MWSRSTLLRGLAYLWLHFHTSLSWEICFAVYVLWVVGVWRPVRWSVLMRRRKWAGGQTVCWPLCSAHLWMGRWENVGFRRGWRRERGDDAQCRLSYSRSFHTTHGNLLFPQCHWVIPFSDFITPCLVLPAGFNTKLSAIIKYHDSSVCTVSTWIRQV
jgi:hypothetical protein